MTCDNLFCIYWKEKCLYLRENILGYARTASDRVYVTLKKPAEKEQKKTRFFKLMKEF